MSPLAFAALASRLAALSGDIDRRLSDETADRQLIAEDAAAELARLAVEVRAAIELARGQS